MENRLDVKLKYLYEMLKKYNKLNDETKYKYLGRENSIQSEIEALEELKNDDPNNSYNECYEEDFKEAKRGNK